MPAMDTAAKVDEFSASNRRDCEKYVNKMQRQIHKAVEAGKWRKARYLIYLLTRRSKATKILATYRITTKNRGKHTAGVDNVRIPKGISPESVRRIRHGILKQVAAFRKPRYIRRIYIPKPNGKKRPPGIPVMLDRIAQDIIRMAIEPIMEYHFDDCSYGFRPRRSCRDAIEAVYKKLSKNYEGTPKWVVEGDIKGCFDNIEHEAIHDRLRKWHIPETITKAIGKILRAEISERRTLFPSESGTPQGGALSPWGLYYKHVVSKGTFAKIDSEIYQTLWRWSKRRHPTKGKRWIKDRYFKTFRRSKWTFTGEEGTRLMRMSRLPITSHHKTHQSPKWNEGLCV